MNLSIAQHTIGPGQPCFVIAEAGVNHNGQADLAYALIDLAASAGADAVKFQTFNPEKLVSASARKARYQIDNTREQGSQLAMLEKLTLSAGLQRDLQHYARQKGILFLSSPFDEDSADFLASLNLPAFKIPSGEITNTPLLRHLAAKGRPLLLSTGMCTLAEVETAMAELAGYSVPVGLFHCVSNYPTAAAECNLTAMHTLRERFQVPVGWSDHTEGTHLSVAAVALGANILEKHFTLDKSLPGPDHKASLSPSELKALVRQVRDVEASFGDGIKQPQPSEADVASVARKSLFVSRDLPAGHTLSAADLVCLRPGDGLSPTFIDQIVGQTLRQAVTAYSPLHRENLQGHE